MLFDDTGVTVKLVNEPRANHGRIAPGYRAAAQFDVRGDMGETAVLLLAVPDEVDQPLGVKRADAGGVQCRRHEKLRVAGPAQAFVTLRAVRRRFKVVAFQAPRDIVKQLVQERVRGLEFGGDGHISMQYDTGHGIQRERRFYAAYLHVPEPVEGECRFQGFLAAAGENIGIRRLGAAQRFRIGHPVILEHFRMPHLHALSGLALHVKARPAYHVLAQVIHINPGLRLGECQGRQAFKPAYRRARVGLNLFGYDFGRVHRDGAPVGIRIVGHGPTLPGKAFVPCLAHKQVCTANFPGCGAPLPVRSDDFARTVLIIDFQLREQARLRTV
ncbi:MAG: hypothetical protein BWX80_02732 [Candidatus Hydrogenedentes bacterium ADurb.Bin101]|nr:MAG: hypothetical protein BWX80_02732 [Candidatus Hydrogenedentes bacterium ADurb.Bin101]